MTITTQLNSLNQAAVAEVVRTAYEAREPILPTGGKTSLDYGGIPPASARELDLTNLNKIVDYTPRDMTIVVESGVRMADLAATLAAENQLLPIDVPRATEATIGGAVATNWSGPRRSGYGTFRDYVIGIHAVDGRGVAFKGGGRVVKNVAGYDFCKLLTGSLGTLGIITQLAFKVKPLPEASATIVAACSDFSIAEEMLRRLSDLPAPPIAVELLVGSAWNDIANANATLVVRVEGGQSDTNWLAEKAQYDLWAAGATEVRSLPPDEAESLWSRLNEFSDRGPTIDDDKSPLVLKFAVPPSAVVTTIADVRKHDPACTIQSHAANGIVFARFSNFAQADVNTVLVGKLRPAVAQRGGSVVVVRTALDGLTPHIRWGGRTEATVLMERIKHEFDPHNILNPGRFVF